MRSEDKLFDLIGCIYDAGIGTVPWSWCLDQIASTINSFAAVVQVVDLTTSEVLQLEHGNAFEGPPENRNGHGCTTDPSVSFGLPATLTRILGDKDAGTEREPVREDSFANYQAGQESRHFAVGGFLLRGDLYGQFSVRRSTRGRCLDEEQIKHFERLLPHVRRAIDLEWRYRATRDERDCAVEVLNRLTYGVIMVTASGRIIRANRMAKRIMSSENGLGIKDGILFAATQADNRRLHALLDRPARTASGDDPDPGDVLLVGKPSFSRPLSVLVSPLRHTAQREGGSLGPRGAAAILFVHDPEIDPEVSNEVLKRLFGLTPAETRLAGAIATGANLKSAAERFGISTQTARTQLKSIFGKTGTHGQSELVRLILSSPTVLGL